MSYVSILLVHKTVA